MLFRSDLSLGSLRSRGHLRHTVGYNILRVVLQIVPDWTSERCFGGSRVPGVYCPLSTSFVSGVTSCPRLTLHTPCPSPTSPTALRTPGNPAQSAVSEPTTWKELTPGDEHVTTQRMCCTTVHPAPVESSLTDVTPTNSTIHPHHDLGPGTLTACAVVTSGLDADEGTCARVPIPVPTVSGHCALSVCTEERTLS